MILWPVQRLPRSRYVPRPQSLIVVLSLQNIKGDLRKHATEAIRLEQIIMELPSDADVQTLAAHLAGIRTKIATLLSKAENGTSAVSVSVIFV